MAAIAVEVCLRKRRKKNGASWSYTSRNASHAGGSITISELKGIAFYAVGLGIYFPMVYTNFMNYANGGWLDTHEVYYTLPVIAGLGFFYYSFLLLDLPPHIKLFLFLSVSISYILGIPNISYPIGSNYFDAVRNAFSVVSMTVMSWNILLFAVLNVVVFFKHLNRKGASSVRAS